MRIVAVFNGRRWQHLTEAEIQRILWWLHRPVPPGPEKDLDYELIRKLS